ncbi:MAG: 23S rRNA (guanosine(2251)-2'-O)-methyltransferase RlmB [Thiothrix sp.]|nr:23S rRNA (guanosine(2251)-2'-O)-methyltransferase RlmB [Thiothrix sp.]HPE61456.1 23S rRNA (guanosine(2251)-2'-O)-methyltransferase RlmB [Thiolinea sp.]
MSRKTIIYGIHALESALHNTPEYLGTIWLEQGARGERLGRLLGLMDTLKQKPEYADQDTLTRKAGTSRHQGIVAEYHAARSWEENDLYGLLDRLQEDPFLLILDGITDPHNLGACLRTAEGAGVQAVIAPRDNAAGITPTVRKVASGAAETLPFISVTNLARTLDHLKQRGIWLTGTSDRAGQSLYQANLTGPAALVLGAEGKGIRRLTEERCDFLVSIPMAGQVSSLNVSVATGVCLFEAVRQRRKA